jgi:hypothetical protein
MGFKDALSAAGNAAKNAAVNAAQNAARTERFPSLGVTVLDGEVYEGRRLAGPLAGARAELTDTVKKHRVGQAAVVGALSFGAGVALGLTSKKSAFAYVTFADGNYVERKITGKNDIQKAQREIAKFNALARGATQSR